VSTTGHGTVMRRRLAPGEMLSVDPAGGGVVWDDGLKHRLATSGPYAEWLGDTLQPCSNGKPLTSSRNDLTARRVTAVYTKEEITVVLRPMATAGPNRHRRWATTRHSHHSLAGRAACFLS
jgi:glutamate synthase (NADPH/NADH) large chain